MNLHADHSLVEKIIALELDMFIAVRNRGGVSVCQERPESFRLMREITHAVLSERCLLSYLNDLEQASAAGRNLMTEKYALMERVIPRLSEASAIREIVRIESEWRKEVSAQFPRSVEPDGHESFCVYLESELQTYSPATLAAYLECVEEACRGQRNLVRERYDLLMSKIGRGSLAECEAGLTNR